MKYIKKFRLFESEEFDFVITEETTKEDLTEKLEEIIEGMEDYGNGQGFVDKCCNLLGEDDYDEFENRFDVDYFTTSNEYDETKINGTVKLDDKLILTYESHGDGYGFGGDLENIDYLLGEMKKIKK